MPLCRTMYGVTGNVRVRLCEGTKVAAVSEGISGLCSILYTGASGNKCGLSLEQRRASFVGIKNRQNKGLQSCSIVQHHLPGGDYAIRAKWGLGWGELAMLAISMRVGYLHIVVSRYCYEVTEYTRERA